MFSDTQRIQNYQKLANVTDAELADKFDVTRATVWFWSVGRPMNRLHKMRLLQIELEYLVSDKSPLSEEAKRMIQDGYARSGKSL